MAGAIDPRVELKAEQAAIARARWERRVQFVFGECVLDTGRRELSRGSEPVAVGPQVFDLLIHLIENRDRVVSKDELFDVIWRGRTVSESTLNSHVNFARRAIGDNGEEQRLIRTISLTGWSRTSSERCRACDGFLLSRAIRASLTKAARST
jgi:DNA-binding winged helix-turn-helix (wHTH) protein